MNMGKMLFPVRELVNEIYNGVVAFKEIEGD